MTFALRIAVACSGLGHVQRGIESWAADLASALQRTGTNVSLFGGGRRNGAIPLATLRRTGRAAIATAKTLRHLGGWRYGMGSPYDVEQASFAFALWRRIHRDFDILHVQDPMIATWLQLAHRAGLSRPAVIYANGTGEGPAVMQRFTFLQLLTQPAVDTWMPEKPPAQSVFMIPNFVDTACFYPGDQNAARTRFGLPLGPTIILCCAAIRRVHKRIDILLQGFAELCRQTGIDAILVIAGGREPDTDDLIAEGTALLGDRVRFLPDLARESMPELYRCADAFVLASLYEMFGIVLLEALATGLPVLCNDTAAVRAIVGPGGLFADLTLPASIARGLAELLQPATRASLAQAGRAHVAQYYSQAAVTDSIVAMYQSVVAASSHVR